MQKDSIFVLWSIVVLTELGISLIQYSLIYKIAYYFRVKLTLIDKICEYLLAVIRFFGHNKFPMFFLRYSILGDELLYFRSITNNRLHSILKRHSHYFLAKCQRPFSAFR